MSRDPKAVLKHITIIIEAVIRQIKYYLLCTEYCVLFTVQSNRLLALNTAI